MRAQRDRTIEVQSETVHRVLDLLVRVSRVFGPEQSAHERFEEVAAPRFSISEKPAREPVNRTIHGEMPAVEAL